jgi:16S rRNA (cytidine1402-2'-O)-methyltransferase
MSGTLFVVATPIGNLEDITLRALRVLREADVIAAEDTRRTARLLAHHAIATPTVSFHEHNTRTRIPQLVARLQAGERVALVTDAGTPGVSDPGVELVEACVAARIRIDPVPGPSAPLTAAAAAGFPLVPFTFLGFPPHGAKDKTRWFQETSSIAGTLCFFEAPHRIVATLNEAAQYFGSRPIVVARELTKIHQEFVRGTVSEVQTALKEPRGEFTVIVGPAKNRPVSSDLDVSDRQIADEFSHSTEIMGLGRRAAVSTIAKRHGRPAREVYAAIERTKCSGE